MTQESNIKIALVIDAENTSVKYLEDILKELRNYGEVTYKRMYGDFTDDSLKVWNLKGIEHSITPIHQPRYSKVKNASDIALVIDAMDILFARQVDGFCIVSSDSDFTRLVNRLRENGMLVIGMGKSNASKTLKAACSQYIILETLDENNELITDAEAIVPLSEIKNIIMEIVQQSEEKRERAGLGGIKSQIQRIHSDFSERNYGYNSMTTFIREMKEFEIKTENSSVFVERTKYREGIREEVESFIKSAVGGVEVDLAKLGQMVHNKFPDFNHKNYGYSQFLRFVTGIDGVEIVKKSASQKSVTLAKKK